MLIVLFLISVGILISGLLVYKLTDYGDENPYSYIGIILGILLSLGAFVTLIVGGITISESSIIDDKIQMYTEENTNIETTITATVEKYLEHELNIFDSLQGEDIQTLLVVYPEINSNELVKAQIEVL